MLSKKSITVYVSNKKKKKESWLINNIIFCFKTLKLEEQAELKSNWNKAISKTENRKAIVKINKK